MNEHIDTILQGIAANKKQYAAMKLVIIILLVCSQLGAQSTFNFQLTQAKKDHSEKWKTIAIYTGSIALNAIGDGLNDSGKKTAGHICNALSIGTLLASPFIMQYNDKWYKYLLSYTFIRVGVFDLTYNATRHLPYNYTGTTSITDKIYNKGNGGQTFVRATCLIIGFSIPLNSIK